MDEILTLRELANYLRCHTSTLYRLIKSGEIPYFRIGSDFRFRTSIINEWIEKRSASIQRRQTSKMSRPRPGASAPRRRVARTGRSSQAADN